MLTVLKDSIMHLNERGYIYVWGNVLWFVLSLPIITAPAAWAGLVHLSHTAQTKPQVSLEDFWEGFKTNLRRGVFISLVTIVIGYINVVNLFNFTTGNSITTAVLRTVWIGIILLWVTIQLYLWPLLEEMESPTLISGIRNALVMMMLNPLFTLALFLTVSIVVALSIAIFPVYFLLTGSVIALITTSAMLNRLQIL